MKIYLKITILSITLLFCNTIVGQDEQKETITVPLSNPGQSGTLKVSLLDGSITVKGYKGTEVQVDATSRSKGNKGQTKNGLKRISDGAMAFVVEENNNNVSIRKTSWNGAVDFEIRVPENFSLKLAAVNNGNIYVEKVNGEMEISNTNGGIEVQDVSGSVVADALNADINVSFLNISENTPMAFSSLNGNIDITFPKNLKASIKAKTDNGDVYTDFEIEMTKATTKKESGNGVYKITRNKWVIGDINGGGAEMTFKTLNGDVMIRARN
jgi:hypothetical protein